MELKLNDAGGIILGWIIANFLGVAAIGAIILILPFFMSFPGMPWPSLIIGLPIGFAQWIALRRVAPISILWVLTISAGLLLGLVVINGPIPVGILGFLDDESVLSFMIVNTTIGLFVGLAQCLLLRVHFIRSLIWVISSGVGFGLGTGLVIASDLIDRSGIVSVIIVVLVYAIATGFVISWLPASRRKAEGNQANVI